MEFQLKGIKKLLRPKEGASFVFSSNTTDWTTTFSPLIYLDPDNKYELALVNLETYNAVPNITKSNNTFVYRTGVGDKWKTLSLPEGSYELAQINDEIQCQLKANGDWNSETQAPTERQNIVLGANRATLRAYIEITNNSYEVDMAESTVASTLEGVILWIQYRRQTGGHFNS